MKMDREAMLSSKSKTDQESGISVDQTMSNPYDEIPNFTATAESGPTDLPIFRQSTIESRRTFNQCNSRVDSQMGESGLVTVSLLSTQASQFEEGDTTFNNYYLTDEAKIRFAEASNSKLGMAVAVLEKDLASSLNETEKLKIAVEAKNQEHEKMMGDLQTMIKDLQEVFHKQSIETGEEITAFRTKTDKRIDLIREVGENKLASVRKQVEELKANNLAVERLVNERKDGIISQPELSEEGIGQSCTEDLLNEVDENATLVARNLPETQTNASEAGELQSAIKNVNEMLSFQNDKCRELSGELKLMSQQYVESMEKLQAKTTRADQLTKELDCTQKRLLEEKQLNVALANNLEDMARGFVDIDDQLEKEKTKTKEMSALLADLKEALESERAKPTKALGDAEKWHKLSRDLKLLSQDYIESLKKLDAKTTKTNELAKELDSTERRLMDEKQLNAALTNNLEEIARGFVVWVEKGEMKTEDVNATAADLNEGPQLNKGTKDRLEPSRELKLLSQDYMENLEKLQVKSTKADQLAKDLDSTEKKLLGEKRLNAELTNNLEDMARGIISLDEQLLVGEKNRTQTEKDAGKSAESKEGLDSESTKLLNLLFNTQNLSSPSFGNLGTSVSGHLSAVGSIFSETASHYSSDESELQRSAKITTKEELVGRLNDLEQRYITLSHDIVSDASIPSQTKSEPSISSKHVEDTKDESQESVVAEESAEPDDPAAADAAAPQQKTAVLADSESDEPCEQRVLDLEPDEGVPSETCVGEGPNEENAQCNNPASEPEASCGGNEQAQEVNEDASEEADDEASEKVTSSPPTFISNRAKTERAFKTMSGALIQLKMKIEAKENEFNVMESKLKKEMEEGKKNREEEVERVSDGEESEDNSHKSAYAGLALQELHKKLVEEQKNIKSKKEGLRSVQRSENERSVMGTPGGKSASSSTGDEKEDAETELKEKLAKVMREMKSTSDHMETLIQHSKDLEEQKNALTVQLQKITEETEVKKDALSSQASFEDRDGVGIVDSHPAEGNGNDIRDSTASGLPLAEAMVKTSHRRLPSNDTSNSANLSKGTGKSKPRKETMIRTRFPSASSMRLLFGQNSRGSGRGDSLHSF